MKSINQARAERGLSQLQVKADLTCATVAHAKDIGPRRACNHNGSDGSSPWDRAKRCGSTFATGEVLACGQGSSDEAVKAWIGSPGHNRIMFDQANRYVGVAMVNNFWVALFSKD